MFPCSTPLSRIIVGSVLLLVSILTFTVSECGALKRRLPQRPPPLYNSHVYQADILLEQDRYCTGAAFLYCARHIVGLRGCFTLCTHCNPAVAHGRWRRQQLTTSGIWLKGYQRESSPFVNVECEHHMRRPKRYPLAEQVNRDFFLNSAFASTHASSTEPSSLRSPCGCFVTFLVKRNLDNICAGNENKQSCKQRFSGYSFPPPRESKAETTVPVGFECAAKSRFLLGENVDASTPSDDTSASYRTHAAVRDNATIFLRTVKLPPDTRDSRLDVFLTKCMGISRTFVSGHLIKGGHIWVNNAVCVTPSRRLRPGDSVTCVVANSCSVLDVMHLGSEPGLQATVGWFRRRPPLTQSFSADQRITQQETAGLNHWRPISLVPDERPIQILYEDDHLLVLNKPANVLTHPPELNLKNITHYNEAGSMVQRLLHHFYTSKGRLPETFHAQVPSTVIEGSFPKSSPHIIGERKEPDTSPVPGWDGGEEHLFEGQSKHTSASASFEHFIRIPHSLSRPEGIVHRLDFGTTGVLAVAKTFAAAADLREQWKRREVFKGYLGVCCPELRARRRIDAPISRHHKDRARMQAIAVGASEYLASIPGETDPRIPASFHSIRKATTIISPIGGNSAEGLVAAIALTGRTHQVRVHLEFAGHPIVGDRVYGQPPKIRNKKSVARANHLDTASPCCDKAVGMEETAKLCAASYKGMPWSRRTSPQARNAAGRASKRADRNRADANAEAVEVEHCIQGTRGDKLLPSRPLLHAYLLRLRHPVTGCYREFKAPVPPDIQRVADHLNTNWRSRLEQILHEEVATIATK